MEFSVLEPVFTKRLVVRRPAVNDLSGFLAHRNHPDSLKYQQIEPMPEDIALAYLEKQESLQLSNEGAWVALTVELRSGAKVIGEIGVYLKPQNESAPADQRQGDIGWSIHPDYHRRGYATEAVPILLAYVFNELKLHRVTATCDSSNTASYRLMERLGMRREGHFRDDHFAQSGWTDVFVYAIRRSEWISKITD